jgi:hypothetical protein
MNRRRVGGICALFTDQDSRNTAAAAAAASQEKQAPPVAPSSSAPLGPNAPLTSSYCLDVGEKYGTKEQANSASADGIIYKPYPGSIYYDGFGYTKKHEKSRGASFTCKCGRSTGCTMKVELTEDGEMFLPEGAGPNHLYGCYSKNGRAPPDELRSTTFNTLIDVKNELMAMVDNRALSDVKRTPADIADEVIECMTREHGRGWTGLTRQEMIIRVKNTRTKVLGEEGGAKFRLQEDAMKAGFMRFSSSRQNPQMKDGKIEESIGFSHPLLKDLLNSDGVSIFDL